MAKDLYLFADESAIKSAETQVGKACRAFLAEAPPAGEISKAKKLHHMLWNIYASGGGSSSSEANTRVEGVELPPQPAVE